MAELCTHDRRHDHRSQRQRGRVPAGQRVGEARTRSPDEPLHLLLYVYRVTRHRSCSQIIYDQLTSSHSFFAASELTRFRDIIVDQILRADPELLVQNLE